MVNAQNGHYGRLQTKEEHGMLHSVHNPSGQEVSPYSYPGQVRRSGKVAEYQFFRLYPLWGRGGRNAGIGYALGTSDYKCSSASAN